MSFALGRQSRKELTGVHPRLVAVVERAMQITSVDFTVHDGIRTDAEQRRYVALGVSKTMNSKHLRGLAVDLVPWIEDKPRWWWPPIFQIAAAMHRAANELETQIRWGAVWDRSLNELAKDAPLTLLPAALEKESLAYTVRHPGKDFLDGPHYELII